MKVLFFSGRVNGSCLLVTRRRHAWSEPMASEASRMTPGLPIWPDLALDLSIRARVCTRSHASTQLLSYVSL
jgi:hypothetical protein